MYKSTKTVTQLCNCSTRECQPEFDEVDVTVNSKENAVREIIEAKMIEKLGTRCASMPPVSLPVKEPPIPRADLRPPAATPA